MSTSVAQHPLLWLLLAFLVGIFLEWLLEVFFFRKPLADARTAARRRGEEFDSERFAHSRTQAELKAKLTELDAAQKNRVNAETTLRTAQSQLSAAEARLAETRQHHSALAARLDSAQRRGDLAERDLGAVSSELTEVRLQLAQRDATIATETDAARELRTQVARQSAEGEEALAKVNSLEAAAASHAAQAQTIAADLASSKRERAAVESALAELRPAYAGAQKELTALRTSQSRLETEGEALKTKLQKLERSTIDTKSSAGATEQKLKARIEEVKQLTAQLGEASEELSSLKTRAAQMEANWTAAQATRKALEKEIGQLTSAAPGSAGAPAKNSAQLSELQSQIAESRKEAASWRSKAEDLEAELLATARAHQTLEGEVERLRSNSQAGSADDELAGELEAMTRERNQLAAELAALKSKPKR